MTSDGYSSNSLNQSQINNESILQINTTVNTSSRMEGNNSTINFQSISRIDSNQLPPFEEYENNTSTAEESRRFVGGTITSVRFVLSTGNRYRNINFN